MYDLKGYLNCSIIVFIIAEISGYHKEKWHCTSGKYFYDLTCLSWKAYMNTDYQKCCYCFCHIQTFVPHLITCLYLLRVNIAELILCVNLLLFLPCPVTSIFPVVHLRQMEHPEASFYLLWQEVWHCDTPSAMSGRSGPDICFHRVSSYMPVPDPACPGVSDR